MQKCRTVLLQQSAHLHGAHVGLLAEHDVQRTASNALRRVYFSDVVTDRLLRTIGVTSGLFLPHVTFRSRVGVHFTLRRLLCKSLAMKSGSVVIIIESK